MAGIRLNTTLVLDVSGGRTGMDHTLVGLVDIAPTVAWLLGLDMVSAGGALPVMDARSSEIVPETHREGRGAFSQEVHRNRVEGRVYLDRGGRVAEVWIGSDGNGAWRDHVLVERL